MCFYTHIGIHNSIHKRMKKKVVNTKFGKVRTD